MSIKPVLLNPSSNLPKKSNREADELISSEGLNIDAAKRYINVSLKRGYASEQGTDLNDALPKMSPLNPQYLTKKQSIFQKIVAFVENCWDWWRGLKA